MPPKVYVPAYPAGDFRAMPALGSGHAALKWVTSFPGNPARGMPTVTGLVLLSDASNGSLVAVFDAAAVTALRTGAAAVLAAETLGAAQSMLEQAVAYAGQRRQFGRAIASFQAVKHACAEMAAALEPCRAFVWYAAHAQDGAELDEAPSMLAAQTKAHLDEVGREVARTATEVHGGMGFTELLGLPFWFKRIMANRQLLGGPERCREDAALAQGMAAV
jgi:alkylation response protein AidB-like acyl-CoA dehydrogenase